MPGAREKDGEGEVVTPGGIPWSTMLTVLLKPFSASTEMIIGAALAPTCVATDEGETEREKSPTGGGGGALLPQPASRNAIAMNKMRVAKGVAPESVTYYAEMPREYHVCNSRREGEWSSSWYLADGAWLRHIC